MADIAAQTLSWSSDTPELAVTEPTATQVFSNVNKNTTILVYNGTVGALGLLVKNQVQDKWGSVVTSQDEAISIATLKYKAISGAFLASKFRDADEDITITFDATADVQVLVFNPGP